MVEFKFGKSTFSLSFSFFAIITLLLLTDGTNYTLLGLLACIFHELGHIFVMCLFNVSPKKIVFYGAGIKIVPDNTKITSFSSDFFILIAGSLTNFCLFVISYYIGKNNFEISLFSAINLIIGIFNLIPFKHFDGGRIIELFLNRFIGDKALLAQKIIRFICISILIIIATYFLLMHKGNFSLYATLGYIIFSELLL